MKQDDLGRGLNREQACELLGCSRSFFYRLVEGGAFPHAYRLGQSIRVPQRDVDEYREKNQIERV